MLKIGMVLASALVLAGCEQSVTRSLGGDMTIDLPCGQKYVNASWKQDNLWYATRPAEPGERFVKVTYKESSLLGILQGTVIFNEKACS
jgi:hypothetical protein